MYGKYTKFHLHKTKTQLEETSCLPIHAWDYPPNHVFFLDGTIVEATPNHVNSCVKI